MTPQEIINKFYGECLSVSDSKNFAELMFTLLADDFKSIGSVEVKTKEQLTGTMTYIRNIVPDLKWQPEEILNSGNKWIVRSFASGTPKGSFMGIETDGTKSFKFMSIDIHTIEEGKIQSVHHIEDWMTAIAQLKG